MFGALIQLIKQHFLLIFTGFVGCVTFSPILLACIQYLVLGNWPQWAGIGELALPSGDVLPAKTYWDVLEIIIVPLSIGLVLFFISSRVEHKINERIENNRHSAEKQLQIDRWRNEVLQQCITHLSQLLLEHKLLEAELTAPIRNIARARTFVALRDLDNSRKVLLLRFLYDAKLIFVETTIIKLGDADLRGINLIGANYYGVNLSGANIARGIFFRADLRHGSLKKAYLEEANFQHSNLCGTNLSGAILERADFSGSQLHGADLSYSNLRDAIIHDNQLQYAASLRGAIMPDGTKNVQA